MFNSSRSDNRIHQVRNKLYLIGQTLESKLNIAYHRYKSEKNIDNKESVLLALGALDGYVRSRKSICPTVTADVALNQQAALVKSITADVLRG